MPRRYPICIFKCLYSDINYLPKKLLKSWLKSAKSPLPVDVLAHPWLRMAPHSTKIQTGPTGKRGPPQKVDQFFETFPVGPNRSIEFWTEISGNFG